MSSELLYKISWVVLAYLLALSQYKLWFEEDGIVYYWNNQQKLKLQLSNNNKQQEINNVLFAEVASLKDGYSAIEERARNDLGMIKSGETYYQLVD